MSVLNEPLPNSFFCNFLRKVSIFFWMCGRNINRDYPWLNLSSHCVVVNGNFIWLFFALLCSEWSDSVIRKKKNPIFKTGLFLPSLRKKEMFMFWKERFLANDCTLTWLGITDDALWLGGEESPEEICATLHCDFRGWLHSLLRLDLGMSLSCSPRRGFLRSCYIPEATLHL